MNDAGKSGSEATDGNPRALQYADHGEVHACVWTQGDVRKCACKWGMAQIAGTLCL